MTGSQHTMQPSDEYIRSMAEHPASWLAATDDATSVVLSSRVRLARNISGLNYPGSADTDTLEKVVSYTAAARERAPELSESVFYAASEISPLSRDFLIERHLISPTFLDGEEHKAALIDPDERTSVMINEEDHLRIQSMAPGLDLNGAYRRANDVDNALCGSLEIDYDSDFGYLTACPTNVGTGLRASALIHLPGLVLTRDIDTVISRISKLGFVVRGFYGEGSDVLGNLFQISNQTTLGIAENESLHNIESIVRSIIYEESAARDRLTSEARSQIEDKVWRAYGILKYARTLSSEETMNLLSAVRLGISLGLVEFIDLERVNEIL
ncbi:MAG TPA: protein arginine kinase, partial [candidate division Zixibacteria bacterium]|nr:protein arginine kinase [candidate division Zixibacteria bacterium]